MNGRLHGRAYMTSRVIAGLLTRDTICRKSRCWPILSDEDYVRIFNQVLRDPLPAARNYNYFKVESVFDPICPFVATNSLTVADWLATHNLIGASLDTQYPHINDLLHRFQGRLVAAGGAIFKAWNGIPRRQGDDIDLFFIDPRGENTPIEELTQLLFDAVAYLKGLLVGYQVSTLRNEFVVTILAQKGTIHKYQFILRCYPSVQHLLGGFDIGPSMIAWDGVRIIATELGFVSVLSRSLIVDTTRRSTSFEHRLSKYGRYCDVNFPGLSAEVLTMKSITPIETVFDLVMEILDKHNVDARDTGRQYWNWFFNGVEVEDWDLLSGCFDEINQTCWEHHYLFDDRNYCEWMGRVDEPGKTWKEANILKPHDTLLELNKLWINLDFVGCEPSAWNVRPKLPAGTKLGIQASSDYQYPHIAWVATDETVKTASDYADSAAQFDCYPVNNLYCIMSDNPAAVVSISADLGACEFGDLITEFDRLVELCCQPEHDRDPGSVNLKHFFDLVLGPKYNTSLGQRLRDPRLPAAIVAMRRQIATQLDQITDNLSQIKWIKSNPGRQWTSSNNPIVAHPIDWYGAKYYRPFPTGNIGIETTLRLARLRTANFFSSLPKDIFLMVLQATIWADSLL